MLVSQKKYKKNRAKLKLITVAAHLFADVLR